MTPPLRTALVVALVALVAAPAVADDGIPADTLAAVKRATVYVQAQGTGWKGTGSGFVVAVQKDAVLIATNHHVISAPEEDLKSRPTPTELMRSLKQVTVSVVFDPGTKDEASAKAEPITADPVVDLAILRVALPKVPPTPIPLPVGLKLTETMPVYVFGFPFGQILALAKGAPAVTVGKGSVSSLRLDDAGDLAVVQIDGALNPGNSGGPVVDAKGRLIGVAVATIKASQGIGLAIPAAELGRVMKGRLGGASASATRLGPTSVRVRVEVEVVDPTGAVRGVSLYCLPGATASGKPVRGETLAGRAGVKTVAMKVAGGVAVGEVVLDSNFKELALQAVPEGGAGADGATRVRILSLGSGTGAPRLIEEGQPGLGIGLPPPAGWKEYKPKDNRFAVWIPAKARSEREQERTTTIRGRLMKSNVLTVETASGLTFLAQEVIVPGAALREERAELEELIRDLLANEVRGRVTVERNVTAGDASGKEYRIEAGRLVMRVRVFVAGSAVVVLQAVGTRELVDSASAQTFIGSCRIASGPVAAPGLPAGPGMPSGPGFPAGPEAAPGFPSAPGVGQAPPPRPGVAAEPGRRTRIHGGFNDPEFVDEAPPGGLLVGAEVGIGQFVNIPVPHAARPVFRVDGRDVGGDWHGPTAGKQFGRAVAKPGYAVGAITVTTGLTVNGFSMTFMRVVDGRLDPRDSYESPWLGGPGGGHKVTLGGDGTLVVGLIGKAKNDAVTGLGLLYPDRPQPPAAPPAAPAFPTAPEPFVPVIGEAPLPPAFPDPRPVPEPQPNPFPAPPVAAAPSPTATPPAPPAPASSGSRLPIFLILVGGIAAAGLVTTGIVVIVKNRQLEEERRRKSRARRRR